MTLSVSGGDGLVPNPAPGDIGWSCTWRRAVRGNSHPIVLVELSSFQVLAASPAAIELLGSLTDAHQLGQLAPLSAGELEAVQGRRRLVRPDGTKFDALYWSRAIRHPDADFALWGVEAIAGSDGDVELIGAPTIRALGSAQIPDSKPLVALRLDRAWRVQSADYSSTDDAQRHTRVIDRGILDLVHPEDQAALLYAFALATTGASAGVRIRFRRPDRGLWRFGSAVVSARMEAGSPRFNIALHVVDNPARAHSARAAELETRLRRIAAEIQAADVLRGESDPALLGVPKLPGLSTRQLEIVSRLVRGERVPSIARALYLSQSTVRNHLTEVFRRLGVHSQEELIALLRRTNDGPPTER